MRLHSKLDMLPLPLLPLSERKDYHLLQPGPSGMFVLAIRTSSERVENVLGGPPSSLLVSCTPMHAVMEINAEANIFLQYLCYFRVVPEQ